MSETDFDKYPDTKHFRDVVKQAGYDYEHNVPTGLMFRGTVKVHGTHADIVFLPNKNHRLQSRNRIIIVDADNNGFARWLGERDFQPLLQQVIDAATIDLADDTVLFDHGLVSKFDVSEVMIAGEFCGKGVQTGAAVCEVDKFFMIFGIKIGDAWQDLADFEGVRLPESRIFNAREFGNYDTTIDLSKSASEYKRLQEVVAEIEKQCPVAVKLGVEGTGEGVVWTPKDPGSLQTEHPSWYFFKIKGDEHRNVSSKKLAQLKGYRRDGDKQLRIREFVAAVTCEPRLRQGLEYLVETGMSIRIENVGKFLQWLNADILKEESDLMQGYGLTPVDIKKALPSHALPWFKKYLEAIAVWRQQQSDAVPDGWTDQTAYLKGPTTLTITA
ncbi:hypothetical protein MMC14_010714 [Varicellaria rhodocarpa]|nr:hypothetical protein [Varicellaria rhodocarpa]